MTETRHQPLEAPQQRRSAVRVFGAEYRRSRFDISWEEIAIRRSPPAIELPSRDVKSPLVQRKFRPQLTMKFLRPPRQFLRRRADQFRIAGMASQAARKEAPSVILESRDRKFSPAAARNAGSADPREEAFFRQYPRVAVRLEVCHAEHTRKLPPPRFSSVGSRLHARKIHQAPRPQVLHTASRSAGSAPPALPRGLAVTPVT